MNDYDKSHKMIVTNVIIADNDNRHYRYLPQGYKERQENPYLATVASWQSKSNPIRG